MGKFILTEEDRKSIRGLYGLNEQSSEIVSIKGEQPYPNGTDWDLVHGILGSKRLSDDLEKRVSEKLKSGSYRVTDVKISSYVSDNKVITDGTVTLVSDINNPDIAFTTRGSIGGNYEQRHDNQINGLVDRLSAYYQGITRQFGPFIVNVKGSSWRYKQSFFAVSKQNTEPSKPNPEPSSGEVMKKFVISTTNLDQLNPKFKNEVSTYIKSNKDVKYDVDYFDVSSEDGITSIAKLDIVPNENGYNRFSILLNLKGKPQESLNNSLSKNPGSKLIKDGTITINNKEYEYHLIGLNVE